MLAGRMSQKNDDAVAAPSLANGPPLGLRQSVAAAREDVAQRAAQMDSQPSFSAMLDSLSTHVWNNIEGLSPRRKVVFRLIHSWPFEAMIGFQIMVNVALAVYHTDTLATGEADEWHRSVSIIMLVIYSAEVGLRMYVYGRHFFQGIINWNTFDLALVLSDISILLLDAVFGSLKHTALVRCLRVLRVLRIMTAIRVWSACRELYIMLHSLLGACRAMLWSTVLLGLILVLFSVLAVEVIQPLVEEIAAEGGYDGCERCGTAFLTVWAATVTIFQQVVAGDSWGQVTIPLLMKYPWTCIYFVPVLVIVQFGILNLVLVAIVDQAEKAEQQDAQFQAQIRKEAYGQAKKELLQICQEMDSDESGCIEVQELLEGFRSNAQLANYLKFLDVKLEDVQILFNTLDDDRSGTINHEEFVDQLFKMHNQDPGVMMSFIKTYVQDVRNKVTNLEGTVKQMDSDLKLLRMNSVNGAPLKSESSLPPNGSQSGQPIAPSSTGDLQAISATLRDLSLQVSQIAAIQQQQLMTGKAVEGQPQTSEKSAVILEVPEFQGVPVGSISKV
eukprot:TRINITY_DN94175_c0_g1_i1.p1 TRINITY_DN94175_c0_g1~~TRINITY_DN94175_c0_g1_i1.p1  ORF type:complete len:584 (-),score=105.00 TRINITY_DN94175_c0_g1_i1:58-1728(-)